MCLEVRITGMPNVALGYVVKVLMVYIHNDGDVGGGGERVVDS